MIASAPAIRSMEGTVVRPIRWLGFVQAIGETLCIGLRHFIKGYASDHRTGPGGRVPDHPARFALPDYVTHASENRCDAYLFPETRRPGRR